MTFTAAQVFAFVIAVVGFVLTMLNIYDKVTTIKKNADAPINELEKRVTALEVKSQEQDKRLERGDDHFKIQAEYNKRFMKVQLAFIDFELAYCKNTNYADTDSIEDAKQLVQDALTESMR